MLDTAREWMLRIIAELRDEIRDGVPMVGLEPSCVATFRDELVSLLPHDNDGKRLSQQTFLLSEFIEKKMPHYPLPQLKRTALLHGHCHHKALMKMTAEESVLKKIGLDHTLLDSGCCGMAGAFGFEKDHYDVSIACGERVLLPKVRGADPETVLIADGFSCREQIAQTTNRKALHLAQVIELAHREKRGGVAKTFPEKAVWPEEKPDPSKTEAVLAMAATAAVVGAGLWWLFGRKRSASS